MTKYLLLALLIVWLFYAGPWRRLPPRTPQTPKSPEPPRSTGPQPMVECAHCGVHLPIQDAIETTTPSGALAHFCSEDHRRAGSRPH